MNKKSPKNLVATALVDGALALHQSRPWLTITSEQPIVIEIVERSQTVVAVVTGSLGDGYGLTVYLGENPLAQYLNLQYGAQSEEELFEVVHQIGFTIDPLAEIPGELRRVLQDAGFVGRRESLAPWFMAKSPDRPLRNPNQTECRVLLYALSAIRTTHEQGNLKPLHHGDRRILTLKVEGAPFKPNVTSRFQMRSRVSGPLPHLDEGRQPTSHTETSPSHDHPMGEKRSVHAQVLAMNNELTRALLNELERQKRKPERAVTTYFGVENPLSPSLDDHAFICFLDWASLDHRPTRRSKTVAESLCQRDSLSAEQRELLKARMEAPISIYVIDDIAPGESLTFTDIYTAKSVVVHDRAMSQSIEKHLVIAARVYPAGPFTFCNIAAPPLTLPQFHRVAPDFGLLSEGAFERLQEEPEQLGEIWEWWAEESQAPHPPKLSNMDNEPFVMMSLHYALDSSIDVRRRLEARPDVEFDPIDGLGRVTQEGPTQSPHDEVVVATLEFLGDELLVETNSRERAQRMRTWLDSTPGVRFVKQEEKEWGDSSVDDSLPNVNAPPVDESLEDSVVNHVRSMTMGWLDRPIDALGGLTPREAAKLDAHRNLIRQKIVTYPPSMSPSGKWIDPPKKQMLKELGLIEDDSAAE